MEMATGVAALTVRLPADLPDPEAIAHPPEDLLHQHVHLPAGPQPADLLHQPVSPDQIFPTKWVPVEMVVPGEVATVAVIVGAAIAAAEAVMVEAAAAGVAEVSVAVVVEEVAEVAAGDDS